MSSKRKQAYPIIYSTIAAAIVLGVVILTIASSPFGIGPVSKVLISLFIGCPAFSMFVGGLIGIVEALGFKKISRRPLEDPVNMIDLPKTERPVLLQIKSN